MSNVRIDNSAGVCVIHLDDGKANAINDAFLSAVTEGLDRAEAEEMGVVLAGRTGFFSGGLDLKNLPNLEPDALFSVLQRFGEVMLRLFVFPRPVVSACTGHAVAGGTVTLLATDERIAVDGKFKLGLNETALGLSLPIFVTEFVRCQISPAHHHSILTCGDLFSPKEAKDIGIIHELTDSENVIERAITRAKELSNLPKQAYRDNKRSVRGQFEKLGREAYPSELKSFQGFFAQNT